MLSIKNFGWRVAAAFCLGLVWVTGLASGGAVGTLARMWWIYALLSAVFAALTAILAKVGVRGVDSNVATAVRTVVVLVFAWGLVALQGNLGAVAVLSRHTLMFLAFSGVATGVSWLFYFKALQLGPASLVSAVDKSSLALTLVLAALFLGETLTLRTALGCGLILAGTALVVWPK